MVFSDRCKILTAVGLSLSVILSGVLVSSWIVQQRNNPDQTRELHDKKLDLACHTCFTYNVAFAFDFFCDSIEEICGLGWRREEKLPPSCENNEEIRHFVEENVRKLFRKEKEDFETKTLNSTVLDYLKSAEEAFYTPNRPIIHWAPKATAPTKVAKDGWKTIEEFERDTSAFSISQGNPNSFDGGKVKVSETGMYLIYARLTFACTIPDNKNKSWNKNKRIQMEMVIHETPEHRFVLLKDSQSATCIMNGDLTTLFQSGIFRLAKDEKIELRFKASDGVTLSERDWLSKSNIGLIRVGLA